MLVEATPQPGPRQHLSWLRWRLGLGLCLLVVLTVGGWQLSQAGLEAALRPDALQLGLGLVGLLSLLLWLWIDRLVLQPLKSLVDCCEAIEAVAGPLASAGPASVVAPGSGLDGITRTLVQARSALQEQGDEIARLRRELASQREAMQQAQGVIETQRRELANLARIDALTGLANSQAFDESLRREFKRAQRLRGVLSLAVLDLDQFKQFNQAHGGDAGDEALRRVAQLLSGRFKRDTDLVARLGGEEFAVLLPGVGMADAQALLEHVRDELRALQWPEGSGLLTASVGLAGASPAHPYLSPQALMQAADEALYIAKHAGRDRLSLAA